MAADALGDALPFALRNRAQDGHLELLGGVWRRCLFERPESPDAPASQDVGTIENRRP
jgi:hypothetical protein